MKVAFSRRAVIDLESIGDWIAQDNPQRAVTFVEELEDTCFKLTHASRAFPLVAGFEGLGIRRRAYRSYIILYRLVGDVVEILHVVHGARDYQSILSQDFE